MNQIITALYNIFVIVFFFGGTGWLIIVKNWNAAHFITAAVLEIFFMAIWKVQEDKG